MHREKPVMARVNYWGVERRCSLVVEHLLRKQEVAGSIPVVGFSRDANKSNAKGPFRDSNPGPLGPKPRIIPLDQAARCSDFARYNTGKITDLFCTINLLNCKMLFGRSM